MWPFLSALWHPHPTATIRPARLSTQPGSGILTEGRFKAVALSIEVMDEIAMLNGTLRKAGSAHQSPSSCLLPCPALLSRCCLSESVRERKAARHHHDLIPALCSRHSKHSAKTGLGLKFSGSRLSADLSCFLSDQTRRICPAPGPLRLPQFAHPCSRPFLTAPHVSLAV